MIHEKNQRRRALERNKENQNGRGHMDRKSAEKMVSVGLSPTAHHNQVFGCVCARVFILEIEKMVVYNRTWSKYVPSYQNKRRQKREGQQKVIKIINSHRLSRAKRK